MHGDPLATSTAGHVAIGGLLRIIVQRQNLMVCDTTSTLLLASCSL